MNDHYFGIVGGNLFGRIQNLTINETTVSGEFRYGADESFSAIIERDLQIGNRFMIPYINLTTQITTLSEPRQIVSGYDVFAVQITGNIQRE